MPARLIQIKEGPASSARDGLAQISSKRALKTPEVSSWFFTVIRFSECLVEDDSEKFALPKKTSLPTTLNFSCIVLAC